MGFGLDQTRVGMCFVGMENRLTQYRRRLTWYFLNPIRLGAVGVILFAGGLANAQTQWFTPNNFELTCPIFKKCLREKQCTPHADELTIRHAPTEGPTFFELPENLLSTGVLGVVGSPQGQTVMASASPDGRRFFRMVVFPNGSVTVAVLNADNKTQDVSYYGNCREAVG